jgi:hypothetical protein
LKIIQNKVKIIKDIAKNAPPIRMITDRFPSPPGRGRWVGIGVNSGNALVEVGVSEFNVGRGVPVVVSDGIGVSVNAACVAVDVIWGVMVGPGEPVTEAVKVAPGV